MVLNFRTRKEIQFEFTRYWLLLLLFYASVSKITNRITDKSWRFVLTTNKQTNTQNARSVHTKRMRWKKCLVDIKVCDTGLESSCYYFPWTLSFVHIKRQTTFRRMFISSSKGRKNGRLLCDSRYI